MAFTPNANYPLVTAVADFTQGPPNSPGSSAVSLNDPANRLGVHQAQVTRGRQYELDQVQAGQCTLTLTDPQEWLNPANASSPFNTAGNTITTYRCAQLGAWWNAATNSTAGNMLNAANRIPGQPALGYPYGWDPSFEAWFIHSATTSGTTTTSVGAPADGAHPVTQVTVGAATDTWAFSPRYTAGVTCTVQVDINAAAALVVKVAWTGSTPASTTITGNGAYQTATLGFVPTAADTAATITVSAPSAGSYPQTFYVANFLLYGTPPGWATTGAPTVSFSGAVTHSGNYALAVSAPGSTNSVSVPLSTAPGFAYTLTAWVLAQGAGTVATMHLGSASTSTSLIATWQRLAITFTASAAISTVSWSVTGTSYPAVFYLDDLQLELGASASTYSASGPTFSPLFTGYIERYPIQYDMRGFRGVRPLTCVDALSVLSRALISQSYRATILADSPTVYVPLGDAAFPQTVQLPLGGTNSFGYSSIGTNGSINFAGDSLPDGTQCVSVTQQNADPLTSGNPAYITILGTVNSLMAMNPQGFTIEAWVKVTSGTAYVGVASLNPTENPNTEAAGPQCWVGWFTTGGQLTLYFKDPAGNVTGPVVISNGGTYQGYPDAAWHYLALVFPGSSKARQTVDAHTGGLVSLAGTPPLSVNLNDMFIDATTYFGDPATTVAVGNVALYNAALSATQLGNHYQRGVGYVGELSGARVARLLTAYWKGPQSVAAGKRAMAEDYSYGGSASGAQSRFVLDAIQEIVDTERGLLYADRAGTVVFEDSSSRYATQSSLWTFGENPAGTTEYPYTDYSASYDPSYVFSQTNLTRPGNTQFGPLPTPLPTNPAYGQRVLSQEVQVTTDFDLVQASLFYLRRYGAPLVRIDKLTLDPVGNPSLWKVVLGLEISQRITVKRRTAAGFTMSGDYYIEQVQHNIDWGNGTWTVDLQLSPVFNPSVWVLGDATYGILGSTTVPIY